MGFTSRKLSSPVAIYEDQVLNHIELSTIASSRITKQAAEYAWRCSGKLWIECYKIGYWKEVYDYDISSAFPTIAKSLIDTTDSSWTYSDKFQDNADYGFCKGYVTINNNVTVHPIIYTNNEGKLNTPVGIWQTYLTKAEIEFIEKWKLGYFEIESGWWCKCKNPYKKPLEHIADKLLKFKQSDNEIIKLLAKRMSVGGLYGKFGEEHKDRFGKHFNPVYFAYISTICRLQVAEFIYKNKLMNNIIHISVDGVVSTRKI